MDDATLTRTICRALASIPGWVYRPSGPKYSDAEVGLWYGTIGADGEQAVGVRVYDGDDPRVDATTRSVQLRFRGRKNRRPGADLLAEPAFVILSGLVRFEGISGVSRISFSPLGADDNSRELRTDNYLFTLDNPEASS